MNRMTTTTVEYDRKKTEILSQLKKVIDSDIGDDIVSAGRIRKIDISGEDTIDLQLVAQNVNTPVNDEMKNLCVDTLKLLPWVKNINVTLFPKTSSVIEIEDEVKSSVIGDPTTQISGGLDQIKHIIAVSSCKGGVGKSTVAVNLAYTLQRAGAKVGILDADIYGPSLPTMTKPQSTNIVFANNQLKPLEFAGVKLMSMGFINNGAAIMRGPMVNQILNQFVSLTNWGALDYLVIDMPPGTGDIQLTLAQIMNISAAVIVTTPQRLSFVDVVKGIDLFDTVNIPSIAVVENMAEYSTYDFQDDFFVSLGKKVASVAAVSAALNSDPSKSFESVTKVLKEEIELRKVQRRLFGPGHKHRLREMWGMEHIISIPLMDDIAASGDSGLPHVLQYPDSDMAASMTLLAEAVVKELNRLNSSSPSLSLDRTTTEVIYDGFSRISSFKLRLDCRCAVCVEEFTGKRLLDSSAVPSDVKPMSTAPIGRYAASIDWSDGHKSLYPFRQIANLILSQKDDL